MHKKHILSCPRSPGRKLILQKIEGNKLTRGQAITAKCFECCNGYIDGKIDCELPDCVLYDYMPYRKINSEALKCPEEVVCA